MSDPYVEVKEAGGDERDVIFALGRRHVGILMREMLLPATREKAERLTAKVRPDAHETQPARRLACANADGRRAQPKRQT